MERLPGIADRMNRLINVTFALNYDYLWIIQADVEVPPHALSHLLALDVDVAYGVVPWHDSRNSFIVGIVDDDLKTRYYPREIVDQQILRGSGVFAGSSCILIKRRVLNSLRFRWEPNGNVGEDINFAYDLLHSRFSVAVDGRVVCGHLPEKPLSQKNRWSE